VSATITISPDEIRQIFQPRTSNSSRLWELAQKANALAVTVEERWEELPAQKQQLLTTFVYEVIEPPEGIQAMFRALTNRLYLAWIVLKGEQDAFIAYSGAFQRLINAILGRIERENIAYQKALSEVLEEAVLDLEASKAMTAEEACERIRRISDQALKEL
jgi:hypothetical protein